MPTFQMTITFDPTNGGTAVDGPIDQEDLCYSILFHGALAVRRHNQQKQIVVAPADTLQKGGRS